MRKNFKDVGFYPQPVLIIGTYDTDGVPDAMNVGWGGLVGGGYVEINISQGHKTTENLSLKGAFTVSFADRAHLTEADYVGLVSGHTTPDKIARAGLCCQSMRRFIRSRRSSIRRTTQQPILLQHILSTIPSTITC